MTLHAWVTLRHRWLIHQNNFKIQTVLGWAFHNLKIKGGSCSEGRHFHCHHTDRGGEESVRNGVCPTLHSAALQGRDCRTVPQLIFSLFCPCFLGGIPHLCKRLWASQSRRYHCNQRYNHGYRHIQAALELPHSLLQVGQQWREIQGALTTKVCKRKRHWLLDKVTK